MIEFPICPTCGKDIHAYEYPINRYVVSLIDEILNKGGSADTYWIRQKGYGNSTTIASYHGLLVNTGRRQWEVTKLGTDFTLEAVKIPQAVRVYDGEVYAKSSTLINRKYALLNDTSFKKVEISKSELEKIISSRKGSQDTLFGD